MGKDAPDAPDLRPQAEASEYAADKAFEISENQLAWAKEQFAASSELLAPLLKQQFDIAGEQQSNAKRDRARWEKKYQPLEDQFLDQVADYNTQERQTLDAGRAKAGVQQALDAQRQNAQQSLNAYGIDPSQTRSQAVEAAQRTQGALAQASAGNTARNRVEDVGRALLSDASNMGRGLPGQAAASYAGAINAGNSGMGNQNNTTGQFMGALGNAGQWHGQGMGGLQQGANIRNIGYQNQLGEFNSGGGALGALGQLGGMAMGAWAGTRGGAEGGEVPDDLAPTPQPGDTIPTMLKKGEYVVPEEVVRAKGTDFFDKMREKYLGIPMEEGPKKQYPIPARGMAEGGLVTDIQMRTEQERLRQEEERRLQEEEKRRQAESQQGGSGMEGMAGSIAMDYIPAAGGAEAAGTAGGAEVAGGATAGGSTAGGASGAATGGAAAVAPWAAIAAAIAANETWANSQGRRPNDFGEHVQDMFTGKVAERDIDALGDSIGGPIGDVISWAGQGGNPKGAIDGARQVIHGAIDGVAGLFS